MKLLSATVRNYRVHRETTVSLDDDLVLVHGPNESGKSTLAEAIHSALFLKAKGTTALHDGMASDHGGDPEVILEFEAGGRSHVLTKRFGSATKAMTTLESEGEATLTGDSAEEALSILLKVEGALGGRGVENRIMDRWAHLWVWQGQSNASPLNAIEESKDQLRAKLQAQAGHSILSSPVDEQVIADLSSWESQNFTNRGLKTGSDLDKSEKALTTARENEENARIALGQLRQAATNYEQAEAGIERHGKNLSDAKTRLEGIEAQLKTVAALREQLKEKTRLRGEAEKALERLNESDSEIRDLESRLKEAEARAAPQKKSIEGLQVEEKEKKAAYEKARDAREKASKTLAHARGVSEAWQAHCESLRQAKQTAELDKQLAKIEKLQNEAEKIKKKLAPLEDFTEAALKKLSKAEQEAQRAKLELEAYALQVEVLESDRDITLDGRAIAPGGKSTLSRAAELKVGSGTRLRLTPGGAENLEAARATSEKADKQLDEALKALGVDSVEPARERLRQRDNLSRDLASLEEQLEAGQAEAVREERAGAEKTLAKSEARRDASAPDDAGLEFPDDPKASDSAAEEAHAALKSANEAYETAETTEKAARRASEAANKTLAVAREASKAQQKEIDDLKSKLDYAIKKSGDAAARSKAVNAASAARDQAVEAEQSVRKELEELGADQLDIDAQRLRASVEADGKKLADAKERKVVAQTQLDTGGNRDPESELKEAEAEAERCQKRFDQLKHQADVRRYLLEKLRAARQATTEALAKPLEEAVDPYLKSLFGGSRARLHWAADGSRLESFELDRTDRQNGLYEFENLSHGTREQVALALRLAMAQLLAADHDGCLPLVLDDAFTHADKDRIEKLKTLLYQAAQQGLQIILLTCHPENYSGLSATEAALARSTHFERDEPSTDARPRNSPPVNDRRGPLDPRPADQAARQPKPRRRLGVVPADAPTAAPTPETAPSSSPNPQASAFLSALQSLGGKAGNTKLRQQLGWDEASYEAVKADLIASDRIQTGRGRGGSVILKF